jgi:hypothetical protein
MSPIRISLLNFCIANRANCIKSIYRKANILSTILFSLSVYAQCFD